MKHTFLLFATALLLSLQSFAQTGVAINPTGAEADSCAMLDVSSTTKGLLVPRMTLVQRTAIVNPVKGLLVYQNDSTEGFYYYDGSEWTNLSLVNFTESNFTYNSRTGVKFIPNNAAADVDLILQPKRFGAIIAQQPDGTDTGGNRRGYLATDLQRLRTDAAKVASGNYATIIGGKNNTASGENSTAMGSAVIASGILSTAMGGGTTASGHSSTAMGSGSTASGNYSTAMGRYTTAPSYYETALGSFNTNYTPVYSDDWDDTDRLFVVGNGTFAGSRSNALTILKNANTTIGGSLTINGNGTNTSYLLPATRGISGQILQTDGNGGTSWGTGASQWITSGADIYYSTGNVGIGTSTTNAQLQLSNSIINRKIVMYQIDDNDHQFYGLGINSNTLRYQVLSTSDSHVFYAGSSSSSSNELFRIKGTGEVVIPALSAPGVLLNDAAGAISSSVGTNGQVLTTNGSGGVGWANASALTNFSESNFTYSSKTGVKLAPNNTAEDVDIVISPKGTGSVLASPSDGTNIGGNNRGTNAVDLQTIRHTNTHVASGTASVIMGGDGNTASGNYSTVSGKGLTVSGTASTAFGQGGNSTGNYSFGAGKDISVNGTGSVGLGYQNSTMGNYALATGIGNIAKSDAEAVFGKYVTNYTLNNDETDRLFAVGNGTGSDEALRRNAFVIQKNANTTIGGSLTINGNGTNTSYFFPETRGTSGQVLKTAGDGTTSWGNAVEPGTAPGQMQYWNGSAWVTVAAGLNGQVLRYKNGVPTWCDGNINDLSVGDSYQGGIIAYFLQPGDPGYDANVRHGLIAAPSDQSTGIQWYNGSFTTTGATGTDIGTGNANTNAIVTNQGAGSYAAKLCSDLVLGGYSDWYLPSRSELAKLYENSMTIGGFSTVGYWSSSEASNVSAWLFYFSLGDYTTNAKIVSYYVRAVRAF